MLPRLPRLVAPLALVAVTASACAGGRGARARPADAAPHHTATTEPSAPGSAAPTAAPPLTTAPPIAAAAPTSPAVAAAVPTSPTVTAEAPTAGGAPLRGMAPPRPEVVETAIGRSTIRVTYPTGLSPDERAALDTYDRFLRALWGALNPPNPASPELAATVAPDYLVTLRRTLEQDRLTGRYAHGAFDAHPHVTESDESHVRFVDCSLDDSVVFTHDGRVFSPAATQHTEIVVVLGVDGGQPRVRTWFQTRQPCIP